MSFIQVRDFGKTVIIINEEQITHIVSMTQNECNIHMSNGAVIVCSPDQLPSDIRPTGV